MSAVGLEYILSFTELIAELVDRLSSVSLPLEI
jgi:hypothetical protein